MDGSVFFRRKPSPGTDPEQDSAIAQHSKGQLRKEIAEKDKQNRLAWGVSYTAMLLLAGSVGGTVYLGSLPKQTVEYVAVDAVTFRPLATFTSKDMKTIDPVKFKRARIVDFLRNMYSVRPDKKGLDADLKTAFEMTIPMSPAQTQGQKVVSEPNVYERAKREVVYVKVAPENLNPISADTWHVTFRKEITDIRGQSEREEVYNGTVETQMTGAEVPGGFGIFSFSFERSK